MSPVVSKTLTYVIRAVPFFAVAMIGMVVVSMLQATKNEIVDEEKTAQARVVRAVEAIPATRQIKVESQGAVNPRVRILLQAEVAGRVIEVSDSFVAGGSFNKGDVLVKIDPRDYELAVVRAEARVAEASQRLMREEAESDQARKEWEELGSGEASPLVLREPQLMEAQARLKSARADLSEARLRLERTEIKAPFDGRVIGKNFDVGQVVAPGAGANNKNAGIYDVNSLEVRLPLTDRQISLLNLPMGQAMADVDLPRVTLRTTFAGVEQEWAGRIVRTEGRIDSESRVLYAVASVDEQLSKSGVPLTTGMFVQAEISGRSFDDVVAIPREAVRQDGSVLIVGTDSRLHFRDVTVLQSTRDTSFVRLEISDGERICTSPIDTPTENMPVTVSGDAVDEKTNLAQDTSDAEKTSEGASQ